MAPAPKAYSYVRMSTERQLKGDSLRRQTEKSEAYAAEHGLLLVRDFKLHDIGVSAFKGKNSKQGALKRFLDAVEEKQIEPGSYLLVESLDRITRQELGSAQMLFLQLIRAGINIVSLVDKHLYKAYTNDLGDLMYSLVSLARAHDESMHKSERIGQKWAQRRKAIKKKKLTAMCPGWLTLNRKSGDFEIIPERAAIVRDIFESCADGIGIYSITRRLNDSGIPGFSKSNGWHSSYVAKILDNRAVLGELQPHKLDLNGKRVPTGEPEPDYYPAIIEEDLFFRAKNARTQRDVRGSAGKGRKGQFVTNLFSGLATCAYCESTFRFENKGNGPKGGKYLVCDGAVRGIDCPSVRWRYSDFEASFLAFVRELDLSTLINPDKLDHLNERIASLEGRLRSAERKREAVYETLERVSDRSFLAEKFDQIETEIKEIGKDLSEATKQRATSLSEASKFYESKDDIKELLNGVRNNKTQDLYRLRSKVASRIAALVESIFVASVGSVPFVLELLADERLKKRPRKLHIRELEQALNGEATKQRYMTVRFKDGSIRVVAPDDNDPLSLKVHAFGPNQDELVKVDHLGNRTVLSPAGPLKDWHLSPPPDEEKGV